MDPPAPACPYVTCLLLPLPAPRTRHVIAAIGGVITGKYANFSYEQLEEIENLAKAHNASMAPVVQVGTEGLQEPNPKCAGLHCVGAPWGAEHAVWVR